MRHNKKAYITAIMASITISIVLSSIPMTEAAGSITLTPTAQAPGSSITISSTDFGINQAVGVGFGAEVQVINEWMNITGPFDVGNGPYTGFTTRLPIKPTTFRISINISSTTWFQTASDVAGNGTLNNGLPTGNVTLNYVTGNWTRLTTSPVASSPYYKHICNYTAYEYNVTPAAGVTTNSSGGFTASITVPNVANGIYTITAVDTEGHIATTTLTVTGGASGWSKTYGGANAEGVDSIYPVVLQTSDGGFLLTGDTRSYGAGSNDAYLVKTDANGEMQWNKTYGGPLNESACVVSNTSDGGYAIMCITNSYGAGGNDFWLLKTDANGNLQWNRTYGGADVDNGYVVFQTADGGYVMMGDTNSFGAGGTDAWLVKTDASGNTQWNKTYGAAGNDYASCLMSTADGGYAVLSYTMSFGGYKAWLFKIDSSGNMVWNKTYGVGAVSWGNTGIQTADGGYAITGVVWTGGKRDAWLIKTDPSGNMLWNKTYGGTGDDTGWAVEQMEDGDYAIVGVTSSFGAGGVDGWLFRTDSSGNMLWNRTYGGAGTEFLDDIILTSDGGYALAGFTDSFGAGSTDLWLIKTDEIGVVPEYLSLLVPAIVLTATAFIIINKKRLIRAH
jgi:predicted secreted protein